MTPTDREQFRKLIELAQAATEGPWTAAHQNSKALIGSGVHAAGAGGIRILSSSECSRKIREKANDDMDFIALARTVAPVAARVALDAEEREQAAFRRGAERMRENMTAAALCRICDGTGGIPRGEPAKAICPNCAHLYEVPPYQGGE